MRVELPLCTLALVALPGLATVAHASELITDRPDQTESSSIVARGLAQLEVGFSHSELEDGSLEIESDAYAEFLIRIGLLDRLELRIGSGGYREEEVSFDSVPLGGGTVAPPSSVESDGLGDGSVGIKLAIAEENGARPQTAVIVASTLPVGDDDLTTDEFDPSFRFTFAHSLSDRLSLGYNAGVAWSTSADAGGDEDTLSRAEWTAVLGIAATERVGVFVEFFGDASLSDSGSPSNAFDAGVTYLLRDNLQLDLAGGVGLSDAAVDWFVGVGVSYRFPR